MNRQLLKYTALVWILTAFLPMFCFAAGIQVSPARLDFTVSQGQTASQNIVAINPTADVQLFEVYADDFAQSIKPMPSSFTLESGGKKTVAIAIGGPSLKNQAGQKLSATLSVVAKPLAGSQFSVGAGVKIPLTITIVKNTQKPGNKQLMPILVLLMLSGLLAWYNYKTAKKSTVMK